MSDNLYFIPIIAKALKEPNIKRALKRAFREIKRKRHKKRYAEGFENFKLFMDLVHSRHDVVTNDYIRGLIAELATLTFEGSEHEKDMLTDIICSRLQWAAEFLTILRRQERTDLMRDSFPEIAVLSRKDPARYVSFPKGPDCQRVNDIFPGNYRLELVNTGWTIWKGELTAKELIWSEAHKGENLPLAAGDMKEEPTNEIDLLNNGDLILRTYARTENGCIEIELTK